MPRTARVIAWDGTFTATDLPKIALTHTAALPGATYDWAAETLFPGGVTAWSDTVGGVRFAADGATPQLMEEAGGKYLRFDGVTSRMKAITPVSTAHTIITVFRFNSPNAQSIVHYGLAAAGAGWVGTGASGATITSGGNGRFIVPAPYIAPDTGWHIAILTVDGENSAFRFDDKEFAGSIAVSARDGITLGFGGANTRTAIDYRRVAIIPGGMDSTRRAGLTAFLKQRYGI